MQVVNYDGYLEETPFSPGDRIRVTKDSDQGILGKEGEVLDYQSGMVEIGLDGEKYLTHVHESQIQLIENEEG